jgi:predicted phage tail protein
MLAVLLCAGFLASCDPGTNSGPSTYTISGTINKSDGGPAAGASVQLKQGAKNIGSPVTTDTDGAYTIESVSEGTYTIEVSLSGYTTGVTPAFVVSVDVTGKDLILVKIGGAAYTISGTITTSDGASAAGASVSLKQDGTPIGSAVSAGTNGAYTITAIPAGTYTIEVSLSGYDTGTIPAFTVSNANVTGKDLVLQKTADTSPPAKVSGLSGTAGNGTVTLTWTDPPDADLASIEITWTPSGTTPRTVAKSTAANRANTTPITGLANGTAYTFTVKAVDTAGNKSEGETTGPHTPADTTPPAKVTGLTPAAGNGKIRLVWTDPADTDLASIEITFSPEKNGVPQPISVPKGTAISIIEGLDNGTAYTFTVKAKDAAGNLSAGETATETPITTGNSDLQPPAKVTGLTGTAGDTQVTLTWTDPADTDLASVEITWTSTAGNGNAIVGTGIQTYTVPGLTNGTAYTFAVRAVDNATPTPNKSIEAATTSATPLAPTAKVTVEFDGLPQDETITLNGTQDLSWSDNTQLTVSVSGGSFSAYRWVLDGDTASPVGTGSSLTLDARDLSVKRHELAVFVTTGGSVEYAKTVRFTVTF